MARPAAPSLPSGSLLSGRYALGAKIGGGGMGVVFEATNERGEVVAVKTFLPAANAREGASATLARFEREITACARLRHPNLVGLIDHGVDDATGVPYLVMPRLHGEDLGALLSRCGALEPSVAVPLAIQACRGVAAVHAAGVIHRDLKPSNVFLVEEEGVLLAKVSDFGLAKVQDAGIDSLTTSGALLGTPHYMSPEQASDAKRADVRADVYSLGMILFHALTGSPAFTRSGSFMAFVVGAAAVPPIQDLAPWVAPPLARAVHAALVRSPDGRWPSVAELELGLTMATGFEIANAPIYKAALAPATQATKGRHAPRADVPTTWQELLRR